MAMKLSQALGATPYFWLNLQNNWELSQLSGVKRIRPLAA
jgi:plasmid maintenance system antidote protein VapI